MREQFLSVQQQDAPLRLLGVERGYTLIEMLVAIVAGMVVLIAVFTIQDVTLHQTTREFSRVDATERTQVAIEQIENELHSGCITDTPPIQGGSTSTDMLFLSQYGSAPTLTPIEHSIVFNSAAGTLTDTQYAETGQTTDANGQTIYTFSATPTVTKTLLTNVRQTASTPPFQYFAYQEPLNSSGSPYTDANGDPYMMLLDGTDEVPGTSTIPTASPLADSPSLSSANAANAAEVVITLTVGPAGGSGENLGNNAEYADVTDSVQDGVVLRLTPAANFYGDGNVFLPCQ